ncbi:MULTISPECIES: phage head closure protein [unclassified Chelatococcus]|uniref:phage head closure protein n=1 Tax=unclassified Chelatococcus TaxID=2638111 RepID=UPI001BCDD1F2|nr:MULTISPECIES: phage head closure protein [unclassified Chelatococcus]MBS7698769.1 phage head closure protein [Chelatococcus sp. YT9]MBX3554649.1 phage head closure protein [Chelatococcus sp.]
MSAGELRERVAFDTRGTVEDDVGNTVDDSWNEAFVIAARIMPLKGGESVMADRLQGVQPVIIRVRYSAAAADITPAWRARNARTGTVYNITSAANMDERRKYLDILATAGGADG